MVSYQIQSTAVLSRQYYWGDFIEGDPETNGCEFLGQDPVTTCPLQSLPPPQFQSTATVNTKHHAKKKMAAVIASKTTKTHGTIEDVPYHTVQDKIRQTCCPSGYCITGVTHLLLFLKVLFCYKTWCQEENSAAAIASKTTQTHGRK